MTTKQQNKLAMYLVVKGVLDANNSVWQPMQAFADGYTDFTSEITQIQTLELTQVTDSTGIAQDKKASKAAMATAAQQISAAVHAYAVKTKNNTLANETAFTVSDLTGGRDADVIKDCQNVHDLANTNIASLGSYGITAAKLTALQANIDAYCSRIYLHASRKSCSNSVVFPSERCASNGTVNSFWERRALTFTFSFR